jgi:hypothetical protein
MYIEEVLKQKHLKQHFAVLQLPKMARNKFYVHEAGVGGVFVGGFHQCNQYIESRQAPRGTNPEVA